MALTRPTSAEIPPPEGPPPPPRRRRRRWVTVLVALPVLALLGLTILRLSGHDGNRFTAAALALTPYTAVGGLVITLFALVLGRRLQSLLALVLSISLGIVLTPRVLPDGTSLPDGQHVRVMTANLRLGLADPATLVRLVRDARVDVLALQELTPAAVAALDRAGIADLLPNRVLRPKAGGEGGGILAKVPLRQIVLVPERSRFEMPAAVLDLSGSQDLEVVSVHTVPPVGSEVDRAQWQRELAAFPSPDGRTRPRVLVGDFNATLDHASFTQLIDRGYSDAAEVTGEALRPTWSQWPVGPPVTLDHVLFDRRLGAASAAVYDLPGSDHNVLFTDLVLPR
ncbi:endonuclease/exonuclease/phosphatase family protein [Actinokineospora spheciospongiae]|uniref:endonuclease/exonuclease/phosphatase family protein n=1 Tax=Actinokineospora spheciospongiae TaxID=909613 RepID=UPI0004AF782D|nr:endonuclease/exonuclease/phosphatase family protein [Actinokineospora spheciospongiae]